METIEIISWSEEDIPEICEEIGGWGGFFSKGMRWKDYIDDIYEKDVPYFEAARHSAIENNIRASGQQHQYEGVTPVFSDGRYFAMSFRAWGDFMAAVWSEEENKDYEYMDFYI